MKYQRSGAFSRKSLRRSSILSLLATLIGSVAFAALPRAAWADAPPVTIVTPDQVPTLLANGLAAGDVAGTQASFVAPAEDVAAVVAAAAPVEAGQPLLARSVMPLQSQYFVSDVTGTATDMTTTVYTVPRAGGSSTVLETAVGTIANGMFSALATSPLRPGPQVAASAPAAVPCAGCFAAGGEGGVIVSLGCAVGGTIPVVDVVDAIVCGIIAAVVGTDVGIVCTESHCAQPGAAPGLAYQGAVCQTNSCDLKALIYNGPGRSLIKLASTIIWDYAPGTSATLDSGGTASEVIDSASAPLVPTLGNEYDWTHRSSEPAWAACSATVQVSVTAQWSDFKFVSTGFGPSQPKQATTLCKGFSP